MASNKDLYRKETAKNVLTDGLQAGHSELSQGRVNFLGLKEHPFLALIGDVVSKRDAPVIS